MRISPNTLLLSATALSATTLLGAGCHGYETGIDRSVIQGTLFIPPQLADEGEATQGLNDDVATPTDLGYLAWRVVQVSGTCLEFGRSTFDGSPTGDLDWYTFTAQGSGTVTLAFDYPGPGADVDYDDPPEETIFYDVSVYDLGADAVIAGGPSAGSYGALGFDFDVSDGGSYGIRVGGTKNANEDAGYTLTMFGLDPNETQFLVGAYQESDPFERTDPVGGTSVSQLDYDEDTMTWSGDFELLAIRTVDSNVDTAGVRTDDVNESLASVYLMGADFSNLNSGILAGTMYSSTLSSVALSTDDAETDLHTGAIVTVDSIQPIQYGWTLVETEPNDVELDGTNYVLIGDTSAANVAEVASGLGFVDTISAILTYETDEPAWDTDNDVFQISTASDLAGTITLAWGDPAYDLDMLIFDSTGALIAYAANVDYPEVATLSDFGAVLYAGETYYIQVLGYGGGAGEMPYTVSLEWSSP